MDYLNNVRAFAMDMNAVDLLFEELAAEDPTHFAVRQYAKYKLAAGVATSI